MNEDIIIFAWVIITLLFAIILWKFILLERYTHDLEDRLKLLEEEFYTKKLFKIDKQRFGFGRADNE